MTVISPDAHLFEGERYLWSQERVKLAWDKARQEFAEAIKNPDISRVVLLVGTPASGKTTWLAANAGEGDVYFDACLDLPWKRRPFVSAATEAGLPVEVVWLDTPVTVCLRRNSERSPDRRVPEAALRGMAEKIASSPPKEEEGFALHRINYRWRE